MQGPFWQVGALLLRVIMWFGHYECRHDYQRCIQHCLIVAYYMPTTPCQRVFQMALLAGKRHLFPATSYCSMIARNVQYTQREAASTESWQQIPACTASCLRPQLPAWVERLSGNNQNPL